MPVTTELLGTVTVDTAEIAITDAMYLLADDDHEAGRQAHDVAPGYGGVVAFTQADGVYPVFLDLDESGTPLRVRIELGTVA